MLFPQLFIVSRRECLCGYDVIPMQHKSRHANRRYVLICVRYGGFDGFFPIDDLTYKDEIVVGHAGSALRCSWRYNSWVCIQESLTPRPPLTRADDKWTVTCAKHCSVHL